MKSIAGLGCRSACFTLEGGVPDAIEIKSRIERAIPGSRAEVEDWTGGGDHFRATVVAGAFGGLSRIEQHRMVYDVFGDEIGGPIHALSLKTLCE
jgi:stress-induced morphogen